MKYRALALAALFPLSMIAACNNNDDNNGTTTPPVTDATVRFVNATGTSFDVASNGTVGTGNGSIAYGGSTSCIPINAASSGLSLRNAGTSTTISGFTPAFTTGGNYTVVAYPGTGGTTQFATLSNTYTPTSGNAGLRVFNAANAGSFDTYVTTPGGAMTTANATATAFGGNSAFFSVPASSQQVRFTNAGTQTVGLDAGNNTFVAGQNSTIVLAPAATGTTTLRSFYSGGC